MKFGRVFTAVSLVAATLLSVPGALAQSYPNREIRLIVPFAPGGGSDALARIVGQRLSEKLGQSVIVENRAGAGGNIGTDAVAKSPPDGYTLVLGVVGPISINVTLFGNLPYDPIKDLAPITQAVSVTNLLVVPPSLGVKTFPELIALIKKRADSNPLTFGTGGPGTAAHLAGEMLKTMTKGNLVHVPYKGSGPAIVDLIGGRVDMLFDNMPSALPHVRDGKLIALAVPTAKRSPAVPEIPTVAESGLPGFAMENWYGFLAPAKTPEPIIRLLNKEIVAILRSPEIKDRLAGLGLDVVGNSPEEFAALIREEVPKYRTIVEASGAKLN